MPANFPFARSQQPVRVAPQTQAVLSSEIVLSTIKWLVDKNISGDSATVSNGRRQSRRPDLKWWHAMFGFADFVDRLVRQLTADAQQPEINTQRVKNYVIARTPGQQ